MSSYTKTVAQWNKDHPAPTREEIERRIKERSTRQAYRAHGEYYLDHTRPEFKGVFAGWPDSQYSDGVSSSAYAEAIKGRMEQYTGNPRRFFDNIVENRDKSK